MTQTLPYDFDTLVERRGTDSAKWGFVPEDVLPMWVADMDFRSPPPVIDALRERVEHGVFGYAPAPPDLPALIVERMKARYGWEISPEALLYTDGVMVAVNMAAKAFAAGGGVVIQTPVYFPFYDTPKLVGGFVQGAPLRRVETADGFTYEMDLEATEAAITDETKMLLLCSPHNPIGRVWTRAELEGLADLCERHDLILISDEIHNELLMRDAEHIPTATVRETLRARTVTIMAPSKTFNIPALGFSVVIIEDEALRKRFVEAGLGLTMHEVRGMVISYNNIMGYTAATAAYRNGDPWLEAALAYIEGNRDFAAEYIREHMPQIKVARMEGTYLLWLDCRAYGLPEPISDWFTEHAKVAFSGGHIFGEAGKGHVRMNLGTSRERVAEGLRRMRDALAAREG